MKLKQTSKANLVFAFFFFMIIFDLQSNYSYHVKNKQANKQKCDPIKISKNITVVLIYHFKSCLYFFLNKFSSFLWLSRCIVQVICHPCSGFFVSVFMKQPSLQHWISAPILSLGCLMMASMVSSLPGWVLWWVGWGV